MATRKRNEYLDPEESQSEELGYNSEAQESHSRLHRGRKRRKTSPDREHDERSDDEEDEQAFQQPNGGQKFKHITPDKTGESYLSKPQKDPNGISRSREKIQTEKKRNGKTGVVYLSRIPPFMKPATVKNLLQPYGPITRIFLTPEDPQSHSTRVRHGGNKKRSFVDGWVEFQHKRDAKLVAETLNANIIGGKKGGYYHDDVWNMRYLRGFKWNDLTDQIKNENAERASRLRMEISQTTKENKRFVESVEKAKMLERMEEKRKKRGEFDDNTTVHNASPAGDVHVVKSNKLPISDNRNNDSRKMNRIPDEKAQKVLDMVL